MNRGDIYTVEMPPSNGREQAGTRPAIIVQVREATNKLTTVLVVPLTSQKAAQVFPGTFLIQPTPENGLSVASVALAFQLRAIDKQRLKHHLGKLEDENVLLLQQSMRTLLNL